MIDKDKKTFIELMFTLSEGFRKDVSSRTVELYWIMLKDLSLEVITARMMNHLKNEKFFPAVCEIRQDVKPEERAQADYVLLEDLVSKYVFLDFPMAGRNTVQMKLEEKGRGDLVPFLDRWGGEMLTTTNPTATRAQLVKQLVVEHKRGLTLLQASPEERKQLDSVSELVKRIG